MSSSYQNIGELANSGFEVSVMARLIQQKDFSWNVSVNGSHNKNEIKKLEY